jgi:uncharacterized protein
MEEIIAAISRSIAEDGGVREPVLPAVAPALAGKDDILELTEAVDEDGTVHRIEPAGPAAALSRDTAPGDTAPGDTTPGDTTSRDASLGAAAPEPGHDRILSVAASEAAAVAFARLGALPRNRFAEGELPVGGIGRTLEDIVRDALRPLLRSWLDDHLPAIIERLVREEIARVAGKAGLR